MTGSPPVDDGGLLRDVLVVELALGGLLCPAGCTCCAGDDPVLPLWVRPSAERLLARSGRAGA